MFDRSASIAHSAVPLLSRRHFLSNTAVGLGGVALAWLLNREQARAVPASARLPHFSLPNLLAGRQIVPEFVQEQVRPDVLGPAVLAALDGTGLPPDWYDLATAIHRQLRCDASKAAAREVLELVRGNR